MLRKCGPFLQLWQFKITVTSEAQKYGIVVKTPDSHAENTGSNPVVGGDQVSLNTKENMKNCFKLDSIRLKNLKC